MANVTVPSVIGLAYTEAVDSISAAPLWPIEIIQQSSSLTPGTVLGQSPAANSSVPENTLVTLTVAGGTLPAMRSGGVIPWWTPP